MNRLKKVKDALSVNFLFYFISQNAAICPGTFSSNVDGE
jgi:hypothetical protein